MDPLIPVPPDTPKQDIAIRQQPITGLDSLVSYEAGQHYVALITARGPREQERETLLVVKGALAVLDATPFGGITPIVFRLNAAAPLDALLDPGKTVQFNLDGTGRSQRYTWLRPDTGILEGDEVFTTAFARGQGNFVAEGRGTVTRILSDDNDGSRHQRFLIELGSGQTLLIAHNIDLAPRVDALAAGDSVTFKGEYEWNEKGGVVHWTHHDPAGAHEAGWIQHNGRTYQ